MNKPLPKRRLYCQSAPGLFAFTLVELLVVIAVIAILAALLLPALHTAKAKAASVRCLGNLKQVQLAWLLYADDFNQFMVPNAAGNTTNGFYWMNPLPWMDWDLSEANTNSEFLKQGLLARFLGQSVSVYKCPADTVPARNGPRVRSISMNGQMGHAPDDNGATAPNFDPLFRVYTKTSELTAPPPANAWIFLDEHPGSINDGCFHIMMRGSLWQDFPGSYHNGAEHLSFADGHCEAHKWRDSDTIKPVVQGVYVKNVTTFTRNDLNWLRERSSAPE